ncbi:hypothetical protein AGMMS49992_30380 [Clostridia bacterium]|nr:hypothetical protein AGMMS49992_30380 [Clostridia bacterium]
MSGYTVSNIIQRMSSPNTPVVTAPAQGGTIYNRNPRFLITTGGMPDSRVQRVSVKIGSGDWQDCANNPTLFHPNGSIGNGEAVVFQSESQSIGITTALIRADNDAGSSSSITRNIMILDNPLEDIVANQTHVKATHILTLRSMINAIRHYYGMSTVVWSTPIISGQTQVRDWPFHVEELRRAVDAIIIYVNAFEASGTFDNPIPTWLPLGHNRPRADVMEQLISVITSL